ncbi:hypothetical protein CY0110_17102 [Crocosphaera chwakensis CCY0110]|uniref:Uncharacterized protein n=1 Tax=Crocosphaera chwakensis CCY0110 TaxID=391612 RepID=A3IIA2_9CHRO|nr:hypothetical protein CY0110_17102 [Crocosphaera chwakensis CCY0110]
MGKGRVPNTTAVIIHYWVVRFLILTLRNIKCCNFSLCFVLAIVNHRYKSIKNIYLCLG